MDKELRRKPIKERETIVVDGEAKRLGWIAENKPEILVALIAKGSYRWDAYLSALIKVGIDGLKFAEMAKEQGFDPGVYGQNTGYWPKEW